MSMPRYIIDREEFGCGQTVTREADTVSVMVEIMESIEELVMNGFLPWPASKAPEPERYDYVEVGHLLYGRAKL